MANVYFPSSTQGRRCLSVALSLEAPLPPAQLVAAGPWCREHALQTYLQLEAEIQLPFRGWFSWNPLQWQRCDGFLRKSRVLTQRRCFRCIPRWGCGLGRIDWEEMTSVVSVSRIATLAFLVSVIAFVGYQFPADETFARLRSWYPLASVASSETSPGPASNGAASNESEVNLSMAMLLIFKICSEFQSRFLCMLLFV